MHPPTTAEPQGPNALALPSVARMQVMQVSSGLLRAVHVAEPAPMPKGPPSLALPCSAPPSPEAASAGPPAAPAPASPSRGPQRVGTHAHPSSIFPNLPHPTG